MLFVPLQYNHTKSFIEDLFPGIALILWIRKKWLFLFAYLDFFGMFSKVELDNPLNNLISLFTNCCKKQLRDVTGQ